MCICIFNNCYSLSGSGLMNEHTHSESGWRLSVHDYQIVSVRSHVMNAHCLTWVIAPSASQGRTNTRDFLRGINSLKSMLSV